MSNYAIIAPYGKSDEIVRELMSKNKMGVDITNVPIRRRADCPKDSIYLMDLELVQSEGLENPNAQIPQPGK